MASKLKPSHRIRRCRKCATHEKYLGYLIERLGCERESHGTLVMWPGTNMRWYAVTVEVAGLLNRRAEVDAIEALLKLQGIDAKYDIVAGVKKLIAKLPRGKSRKGILCPQT